MDSIPQKWYRMVEEVAKINADHATGAINYQVVQDIDKREDFLRRWTELCRRVEHTKLELEDVELHITRLLDRKYM